MGRNQSEAEKDKKLLFGEHWMQSFSKKIAEVSISQSGAELRIHDGGVGSDTLSSS